MVYIFLDLEWNYPLQIDRKTKQSCELYEEIIQIGAVKVNENLEFIDMFKVNIKPRVYPIINEEVKKLTHLTEEQLEKGMHFEAVNLAFLDWCGENYIFLTWGEDDIRVLHQNQHAYGIEQVRVENYGDVQKIYALQITKDYRQYALEKVLQTHNINGLIAHNALNDAWNTLQICRCLKLDIKKGLNDLSNPEEWKQKGNIFRRMGRKDEILAKLPKRYCFSNVYESKRSALKDSELTDFKCYICGSSVTYSRWVQQRKDKYISIAECTNGMKYFVRINFLKKKNGWRSNKIIYQITEKQEQLYKEKGQKQENAMKKIKENSKKKK
ncbi:exonuclease domain-containing protein [Anaerotignum sp.]